MANFNGLILTQAGADLQDKIAVSGASLQFTRAAIGDGQWPAGLDPTSLTGLVNEKKSLPIQGLTDEGTGQHKISVLVDNTGLAVGFMTREIGVFADDPDQGEILYQVTSADSPDYLPPDGGATHIEMALDLLVVTSSASSVTAIINEGLVYASKKDVGAVMAELVAHEGDTDNPHEVTREQLGAASAADLAALATLVTQSSAPIGTLLYNVLPGYEPPLYAPTSGQVTLRADYPELWALVEAEAIADETWLTQAGTQSSVGSFSSGDGESTFRWPLLVDFVRAADPANGRPVGTFQADAIRNMTGVVSVVSQSFAAAGSASGVFVKTSVGPTAPNTPAPGDEDDSSTGTLNFDASRVVPTADENRPKSISYPAWIKYA